MLLPERVDSHPLGCHRPRIPDRIATRGSTAPIQVGRRWVVDRAHPVQDAIGAQHFPGDGDAGRAGEFAGVGQRQQAGFPGDGERRGKRPRRMGGFIAVQAEADDAR